jgi:hypothetical protein
MKVSNIYKVGADFPELYFFLANEITLSGCLLLESWLNIEQKCVARFTQTRTCTPEPQRPSRGWMTPTRGSSRGSPELPRSWPLTGRQVDRKLECCPKWLKLRLTSKTLISYSFLTPTSYLLQFYCCNKFTSVLNKKKERLLRFYDIESFNKITISNLI